ncbi:hypothetical protein HIM_08278 [Hirsutella minnesotensis 3608]|uniref:Rhodopsin domain-containing protein n=1 Tax=Hirsutella minnesotensis 3608 TaxID=1043627 RepID=A0A0F7ZYE9_9HYPO|nr:hypothetical protein HIM_08278 [Hirsutella minnesotensis 3608]
MKAALVTQNQTAQACGRAVLDRTTPLKREIWAQLISSCVLVAGRIAFKCYAHGQSLWWDDHMVVLLFIFGGIPNMAITLAVTIPAGLGVDIWALPFENVTTIFRGNFIQSVLYFPQVALLKFTFLFFFLRIFPGRKTQLLIKGTFAFCALYGIAFVLAAIIQCAPIEYYWAWDGTGHGKCVDRNAILWASAVISIALDVWMLAIPLWNIRTLCMPLKRKLGVASMFLVGTLYVKSPTATKYIGRRELCPRTQQHMLYKGRLVVLTTLCISVTIVCCVRLKYLNDFFSSSNPTQDLFEIIRWSTIEGYASVTCASMPVFRLMLMRGYTKTLTILKLRGSGL